METVEREHNNDTSVSEDEEFTPSTKRMKIKEKIGHLLDTIRLLLLMHIAEKRHLMRKLPASTCRVRLDGCRVQETDIPTTTRKHYNSFPDFPNVMELQSASTPS